MKRKALVLVWLAFWGCSPSVVKESPKALLSKLPSSFGSFMKTDIKEFPEKELGAEIEYLSQEGFVVSFYLYDQGVKRIPEGIRSAMINLSLDMAKKDILETMTTTQKYRNLVLEEDQTVLMEIGTRTLKAFYVSYKGEAQIDTETYVPCYTEIYITGYRDFICKARITRAIGTKEMDARSLVGSLLSYL